MKRIESKKTDSESQELSKLLEKLKKAWRIDEIAKRGAYFINSPDSLLDAKLIAHQ